MTAQDFKSHVYQKAERIGVLKWISTVHLRKMKNKIASCSSKGRLTFDPSILEKKHSEMNEIIIHELLHLRYPNHGKMFKLMLKRYCQ